MPSFYGDLEALRPVSTGSAPFRTAALRRSRESKEQTLQKLLGWFLGHILVLFPTVGFLGTLYINILFIFCFCPTWAF